MGNWREMGRSSGRHFGSFTAGGTGNVCGGFKKTFFEDIERSDWSIDLVAAACTDAQGVAITRVLPQEALFS